MARGASLTQAAYERVRGDLLACRIEPGARVNIVDLAARLGVSPGAVREALSRLTSEGLVLAEPQRGFRAAEVSAADLRDLTSVRVEIEVSCLRRALAHGDVSWEARLLAAHHELSRTPERAPRDQSRLGDAWAEVHAAFHEALVSAGDSRYLLEIRRMLYARSERYRRLSVPLARARRNVGDEHRALLGAALARDADRAATLLAEHLRATTRVLLRALFPKVAELVPKTRTTARQRKPTRARR